MRPSRTIPARSTATGRAALLSLMLVAALGACGKKAPDKDAALASLDDRLTANAGNASTDGPRASAPHGLADRNRPDTKTVETSPTDTTSAMARIGSASGRTIDGCGRQVARGPEWADRMPAAFALYPGAHLDEAAGVTNGRCALTVISFTTGDTPAKVIAHYSASARKAGYDADVEPCKDEQRLGGTRGEAAYIVFVRAQKTGGTSVDIVTRNAG